MDHQSLLSVIKPLVLKKSKVHSLSMSIRTLPSTYKVDFSCDKMNFFYREKSDCLSIGRTRVQSPHGTLKKWTFGTVCLWLIAPIMTCSRTQLFISTFQRPDKSYSSKYSEVVFCWNCNYLVKELRNIGIVCIVCLLAFDQSSGVTNPAWGFFLL